MCLHLCVKANSKEKLWRNIVSFFQKNADVSILLRFKVNYLRKMCGYLQFSLVPIALKKGYFFHMVKRPLYLVDPFIRNLDMHSKSVLEIITFQLNLQLTEHQASPKYKWSLTHLKSIAFTLGCYLSNNNAYYIS